MMINMLFQYYLMSHQILHNGSVPVFINALRPYKCVLIGEVHGIKFRNDSSNTDYARTSKSFISSVNLPKQALLQRYGGEK